MEVRLTVAHKKANTRQVRLGPETMIGRAPECQLRIASTEVSRRHCRIQVTDRSICVADLGSANGTFLNGQQIPPSLNVQIVNGDVLKIGPVQFVVECGEAVPIPLGADPTEDLSDTADDFDNVRVISAEDESEGGSGDYPVNAPLPDPGKRSHSSIPLADDDESDRSGSVPGGATVYDRELPPLDRPSGVGNRPAKAAKPAAIPPLSGERKVSKGASSGAVQTRKTPPVPSPPKQRSGNSAVVPPLADSDAGADKPPPNLMGMLGLLGKSKSSGEVPVLPKKKPAVPPRTKADDDLTLRTDDDDSLGSDATIHLADAPNKKRPDPGKKTVSQFPADDPPRKPAKKPSGKSPPAKRSDSSIAPSSDDDDQALADFLKGFDT